MAMLDLQQSDNKEQGQDYKRLLLPPIRIPLGSDAYERTMREMLGTAKYRLRTFPSEPEEDDQETISSISSVTKSPNKPAGDTSSEAEHSSEEKPAHTSRKKLKKNVHFADDKNSLKPVTIKATGERMLDTRVKYATGSPRCSYCANKVNTVHLSPRHIGNITVSSSSHVPRQKGNTKRVSGERSISETIQYFKNRSPADVPAIANEQKRNWSTHPSPHSNHFRFQGNKIHDHNSKRTKRRSPASTAGKMHLLEPPAWTSATMTVADHPLIVGHEEQELDRENTLMAEKMFPSMFNASKLYAKYLGGNYFPPIKTTQHVFQM